MTRKEEETLKCIADWYGYYSQTMKAVEELSELIHAIARHKMRFSGSFESKRTDCEEKDAVAEEIADVIITLYQVECSVRVIVVEKLFSTLTTKIHAKLCFPNKK